MIFTYLFSFLCWISSLSNDSFNFKIFLLVKVLVSNLVHMKKKNGGYYQVKFIIKANIFLFFQFYNADESNINLNQSWIFWTFKTKVAQKLKTHVGKFSLEERERESCAPLCAMNEWRVRGRKLNFPDFILVVPYSFCSRNSSTT